MANRWENNGNNERLYFGGLQNHADGECSHEIERPLLLGRKAMTKLDSILKSSVNTLPTKFHLIKSMCFPVVMYGWELECKESWALKNQWFWTVALEKTPESPLDYKEIKPVNPKGNQSWIFIEKTDAETETSILWPPDANNWLTGKDPDSGKDWRQEKKGTTADNMVGWHHHLGHKFDQAPWAGDGQGNLAYCCLWGCKESDTTEWLYWTCLLCLYFYAKHRICLLIYVKCFLSLMSPFLFIKNSVFKHRNFIKIF